MITLTGVSNTIYKPEFIEFSDGSFNVQLPEITEHITSINWFLEHSAKDSVKLVQVLDAMDWEGVSGGDILFVPYLPEARADRVFKKGNALPLENTISWLASLGFEEVTCYDVHSKVALDLAEQYGLNLVNQEQHSIALGQFKSKMKNSIIVSPDKGAIEKSSKVADKLGTTVLQVDKKRCINTGRILSVDVPEGDYSGKAFTICDDICDGGGTFLPIAHKLKEMGAKEVNLYVTHGIFAKGLEIFEDYVDKLFVVNIVGDYVTTHDIQKFNLRKEK